MQEDSNAIESDTMTEAQERHRTAMLMVGLLLTASSGAGLCAGVGSPNGILTYATVAVDDPGDGMAISLQIHRSGRVASLHVYRGYIGGDCKFRSSWDRSEQLGVWTNSTGVMT